jgi:hypothetical protein
MEGLTHPPPSGSQYFLKTHPISKDNPSTCAPLYLRLHGDGVTSVVLTAAPPKFLRWHDEVLDISNIPKASKQIAISWKQPDRRFGLVVPESRDKYAWESVEIRENDASDNLYWEEIVIEGKTFEVLNVKGRIERVEGQQSGLVEGYRGWIACQWVHGHLQLFWANGTLYGELPPFFERVHLVREWLVPRQQ